MSERAERQTQGNSNAKSKADASDGVEAGTDSEEDKKPAAVPSERSGSEHDTYSAADLHSNNDSGIDSSSRAGLGILSSCDDDSLSTRKRKMNVIYSRRKREKKKRVVAELSQKSVEAQRENVRLKVEGRRLEELLRRALQIATEYERSCLQQSSFALSQQHQQQQHQLAPHINSLPRDANTHSNPSSQTGGHTIWPPGSLLSQPSSNTFIDAELSRQMVQILAGRQQQVASLHHLGHATGSTSGNATGLHSSVFPSLVPSGSTHSFRVPDNNNSPSAMDELIQRNLRQQNQRSDVSLLLQQQQQRLLNSDTSVYPAQLNLSRMLPRVDLNRNSPLPLTSSHLNMWTSPTAHFPANHSITHPPPPTLNIPYKDSIMSNLVRARVKDLNRQQQLRTKDNGPQSPSQRRHA